MFKRQSAGRIIFDLGRVSAQYGFYSLFGGERNRYRSKGRVYHYLDGEMTVWKRQAITRHLDECPPCAEGFYFEIEIRRVFEADDFGAELTPELREAEQRLRATIAGRKE